MDLLDVALIPTLITLYVLLLWFADHVEAGERERGR